MDLSDYCYTSQLSSKLSSIWQMPRPINLFDMSVLRGLKTIERSRTSPNLFV